MRLSFHSALAVAALLTTTTACSSPQGAEAGTPVNAPVAATAPMPPAAPPAVPVKTEGPAARSAPAAATPPRSQRQALQAGPVTLDQMQSRTEAAFRRADTDADGTVSTAELAAATAAGRPGARRWSLADRDGDGRITLEELRTVIRLQFTRADADGDGTLTPEERPARAGTAPD